MGRTDLPAEQRRALTSAIRWEWFTIGYTVVTIAIIAFVVGGSQAMKTAWIEDMLSLIPQIAFLLSLLVLRHPPSRRFPYGLHRVMGGRSRSVRFRYAANSRLREATMWWAFNSIKMSPWAAAAFRDARDQKGQRYHRALRGLAARWTRILWRCWTNHETYDPARHGSAALITAA